MRLGGSWQVESPDSFWVMGPRWARKMGHIFSPDGGGGSRRVLWLQPMLMHALTHIHSQATKQHLITRQMLQICTAKRGQVKQPGQGGSYPQRCHGRYHKLQGVCSLRGPLGRLDKRTLAREQVNSWLCEVHLLFYP